MPGPLQVDAVVAQALAVQPLPHAGLGQQVDRALLEDAGADAGLDVVARPVLEDHRVDARVRRAAGRAAGPRALLR